ncbi:caspase-8 [Rhipicephalus sanguineus]|uniref:caspase-8 n=1 Tax=Rhipicephalus sanguineus TaxID=34632 RepID=UPI0020C4FFB8|nr:caspase-8 [Rhipicephalus sanguineus]
MGDVNINMLSGDASSENLDLSFAHFLHDWVALQFTHHMMTQQSARAGYQDNPDRSMASTSAALFQKVYPMVHSPRGICLIINNHDFGDSKREGSEHDVRRMRYLFEALHFKCIVHWDLPESEMKKKVEEVAALKEHEVADCLVVILMSHGEQNMIYGVDRGKLHLENDIISLFDDENCPALRGKPKVFFIQERAEYASYLEKQQKGGASSHQKGLLKMVGKELQAGKAGRVLLKLTCLV